MEIDRKAGEGVWKAKEEIYKRTSVSSTGFRQKMRIEVDVSDYTTGGMLSIKCKNKKWKSVAFLSKSLNETEKNYEIHDKEMLAIIRRLEN